MREVKIVPYSLHWPAMFNAEAVRVKSIFGKEMAGIHHIGSTSIPSIHAKPVIDILVEVNDIRKVDRYNSEMQMLGYEAKGEHGIAGRRFFKKGGNSRTHHIHVFESGSREAARHLAFRDYMRAHPEEALTYSQLKQRLAEKHPFDIDSYIEGKDAYIKEIEQKGLEWKESLRKD
ncbi:GrpB family protein [Halobacillus massiliensis]|uniref:GrpB family protein n=1 Tax=Halobacillus massiliensis TaxID=1926286 RepID=UPI0015C44C4E|nr:GrpB family protein [Halobacillus massiliensis]